MTEAQIERAIERKIDSLDRRYLRGDISRAAYDAEMKAIDAWEEAQYRRGKDRGDIA